jgi:hypothetical protein
LELPLLPLLALLLLLLLACSSSVATSCMATASLRTKLSSNGSGQV